MFYYHMKLHYSQTLGIASNTYNKVLLPYEITLLSNRIDMEFYKSFGFTTI